MRPLLKLTFVITTLTISNSALSEPNVNEFNEIPGKEYSETTKPRTPVSGEAVLGVSLESEKTSDHIYVYLGKRLTEKTTIKIEVRSPDGEYLGRGEYSGIATNVDWAKLKIKKQKLDPSRYKANDLAIGASIFPKGSTNEMLIAAWGIPKVREATILIHINVPRSSTAEIYENPLQEEKSICSRVGTPSTIKFNKVCKITLGGVGANESNKTLSPVIRISDDGKVRSNSLNILY